MKKWLMIVCCLFLACGLCGGANAADQNISVTPVYGMYKVVSKDSNTMHMYGGQFEYRYGQFAGGLEVLGIATDVDKRHKYNWRSGFSGSGFFRYYILDPKEYWVTPFVGVGIGYAHSPYKLANDYRDHLTWNVDAGLKADLCSFGDMKLNGILAARYQRFGSFRWNDVQALGGYAGLGLSF